MDDKVLFKDVQPGVAPVLPTAPGVVPPATPPPPVSGVTASRKSLKKLLIGVVIVLIVTFLIVFLIPKGKLTQKTKLVWWGLWEDSRIMQGVISDFERAHPTITIEYSKQDPNQYRDRLTARIKNGTGPDLFRFHNTWYPMLTDALVPLPSDVMTPTEFKKTFYPVIQSDLIHNGALYGIPLGADTMSLFVNTDLLKAATISAPTNWDDFVKAAKKLTVRDGNGKIQTAGAALGLYANITHAPDILSLLFMQQGVDMTKFANPEQARDEADALDFYTSFAKSTESTWDDTLDESLMAFARGNLAMYFGYSWDIFAIQKLNPDLHFRISSVPTLYGKNTTTTSYWVEGVSTKSLHPKEALLFMHYLSQKQTAQKFYAEAAKVRGFGEPYARVDLAASLTGNQLLSPFVSQLRNAKSSIFVSDTRDGEGGLNSSANTYLNNAINSIFTQNTSPDSAVATLAPGILQVLQKYGIQ